MILLFWFSPLKDKSEVDVERIKATLMLCYGYVALFSPVSLIVSRMEATILRSITPHFVNVKVSFTKQASPQNLRDIVPGNIVDDELTFRTLRGADVLGIYLT